LDPGCKKIYHTLKAKSTWGGGRRSLEPKEGRRGTEKVTEPTSRVGDWEDWKIKLKQKGGT